VRSAGQQMGAWGVGSTLMVAWCDNGRFGDLYLGGMTISGSRPLLNVERALDILLGISPV
jgi:hypothetical protein